MAKILIIRLTSLGDVIFTIPLACTLHDENNEIGWLVAEKGLDVIKGNPCVDKCHFVPLKEWKKRPFSIKTFIEFLNLIKEIRAENYDIALDCQQMFKNLFLFLFSGAKRRITFKDAREFSNLGANEFVTPKAKFRDYNYHIVERNLDYARYLGFEPTSIKYSLPETSTSAKAKVDELLKNIGHNLPVVVVAPETTWLNKHWSEENWAKLIENIHTRCNLVLTGTNTELLNSILSKTQSNVNYLDLFGKTNVEELREVFSRAKLVISPDSGSAHLAWASSNPAVVAIFTCTPAKRFGPYGDSRKYFAVSSELECQPCFKRKCHLLQDINKCRNYPKYEVIMNIVNELL